jgi:hypothetical protein
MHSYTAYGLCLRSDVRLPELREAPPARAMTDAPEVSVIRGAVDRARPASADPASRVWATADLAFLEYPGAGAYLVRGGRQIIIDPAANADPGVVRLFLLGPVLALLLHQRKHLVLHASAVCMGGGAVAFVADKGMGKSTLAACLHARGNALVADDVVAIDTSSAAPMVHPGFPQLKLFPESAALLTANACDLPRVHPDYDKRAQRADAHFPTDTMPLKRIFVLGDGESHRIEPATGQHAFIELVRHSYLLELLGPTAAWADHFQQAVAVARQAPVLRLQRKRSLAALPELAKLIEEELERDR